MPWVKGQSGNAKGAPRRSNALARVVRQKTRDGEELVEFALEMLRNEKMDPAHRIDARNWLADRGWGKAVEHIEIAEERLEQDSPTAIATDALAADLGPKGMVQ